MTNKQLFIEAHKQARLTVHLVGNYQIAFTLALKALYKPVETYIVVGNAMPKLKALNTTKGFTGTNKPIKTVTLIDTDLSVSLFITSLILVVFAGMVASYTLNDQLYMIASLLGSLFVAIAVYTVSELSIKLINTLTKFRYRHNDNVYFANNF